MSVVIAEKLIALAAGAALVLAPASIALSGLGLPGSYGAATAIALTHVAIPFLALGWLSISQTPWKAGLFAVASWSALAGALVAVSPSLALLSGLLLFLVVARGDTTTRIRMLLANEPTGEVDSETVETDTRIELTRDGTVARAIGEMASQIRSRRPFIDHVHLADRIAFLETLADVSKTRRTCADLELRLDLAAPGEPQSFQSLAVDIAPSGEGVTLTLKKAAPQQEQVEVGPSDMQKRFLATVSHELRTPLNSIIGFSDILRRDIFGSLANDRQREYVNLIHSSGVHLLNVVNTILDVSKINAGTYAIHREPFDLDTVAQECVSMLQPQAGAKGVRLELVSTAPIEQADADRRAIKQIAINLLSNAIKFTDSGGLVSLTTERCDDGFVLSVCDTGIGMSDAELGIIGAPFAQVDNAYTRRCEGTGLGLTVVSGLVQLHGGSLDVKSKPGEGTEVRAFIPKGEDGDTTALETGASTASVARVGKQNGTNGSIVRLAG